MKVLIAISSTTGRESVPLPFSISLTAATAMLKEKGINFGLVYFSGLRIDAVRLQMVSWAVKNHFDAIIMVDDDLAFRPETFVDLVQHYFEGRQVVSALYTTKTNPPLYFVNPLEDPGKLWLSQIEENKLYPVYYLGTGLCIIDVKIFSQLEKPYFLLRMDLEGRITTTEDCYFAENCAVHQILCYVDTKIKAQHLKMVGFPSILMLPQPEKAQSNEGFIIGEAIAGSYTSDGIDRCDHTHRTALPHNVGNNQLYKCNDCGYIGEGLDKKYKHLLYTLKDRSCYGRFGTPQKETMI